MIIKKKPSGYWTNERIREEALKYETPSEFQINSKGAYLSGLRKNILKDVCSHMHGKKYWTDESLHLESLRYKTRTEFRRNNPSAYQVAYERKILDKICSHMENMLIYWTEELIVKEALKYSNRTEFRIKSSSAYNAARKKNILDIVCNHITLKRIYWTNEMLKNEALKYITRVDFQKNSSSAYATSLTRKILDSICTHMKGSRGSSRPERELFELIKSIYPQARKLKDRSVCIENKPYVEGLEIDIFVPELNKGIEFDGKYHHSYKYMRKQSQKIDWPDEDIHSYHEIKDSWFASKGIQILHIKEKDWNNDKEECVKRCLDFLAK